MHGKHIPASLLAAFNNYREERHKANYGLDYTTEAEDAETAINDAEKFLEHVKKLIKERISQS